MPDVRAAPPEPARHRPLAPLRRYLVAIILLATLPLATLACWQILADVRADQRQVEAGLERSAEALSQAVDSELLASFDALATLSRIEALRDGRAADLQALLGAHPPPRRDWTRIFLLDADGRVLADTAQGGSLALSNLYQQMRLHAQPAVAAGIAAAARRPAARRTNSSRCSATNCAIRWGPLRRRWTCSTPLRPPARTARKRAPSSPGRRASSRT